MNAARNPSRHQLRGASRIPSRRGTNGTSNSISAISSPGLSPHSASSVRIFRTLELRLGDEPRSSAGDYSPTPRDMAILMAMDAYRYLDRSQIQTLFFAGPRSCQYRLRWLAHHGLVRTWQVVMRPGRVCRASIFLLSRRGARGTGVAARGLLAFQLAPFPHLRKRVVFENGPERSRARLA